jgi:hypothetical protein
MSQPAEAPATPAPPDPTGRGAWWVLAAVLGASTLLALFMFAQYSRTLVYVRATIGQPDLGVAPAQPLPWTVDRRDTPEECVDHTLTWARECRGIKTMCDMYVEQMMSLCLQARDRTAFCQRVGSRTATAEFGVPECRARGVRRHVDREACSTAYRTIDGHCNRLRFELSRRAADAAPETP